MSTAFNLTAQLNLRGPTNVRNIVSGIRRQLGNITADVNLRIDPAATRNLTQLNTALTNFNATLRTTQTNAANTANALRGLANAINGINANNLPRNMTNIATASNRAAQATGRVTQQVGEARNQMEEFGRQSALAVRRFAAFSISAGIIVGFTNAINKGVRAFVEFDKELVKLQQVTGESAKGLSGLQKTIANLASGLGVSSSELINVSSTLAQAGLSARDTEKALKALALSSLAPSFDDMNKTVEGSIALMRQFGISAGQLDQALGSVNAVAAKFAVEASDIIAAIQRTGGVFAAASKGVSEGTDALNEFIAVFTSIRATTRESAETIATGLRTIFTRIQRGETIEALKQYGVNLTDLEGKFVGAYKAVELLSRGLGQIDPRDLRFSQIVEELGGFRQIGKVIPLIQQFATAQQALAVAQRGQGSLAEDAAIAQLSLANQIAKVREEFLTLIRDIGGTDTFQTIAKSALGLASALIKVADSVKGVLPVLGVVMAIRGTAALSSYARGFAGGMGNMRGGRRAAGGGYIKYAAGGQVPVALMPGEAVIYPEAAKRIGTPTLRRMNYADKKMAKGGKVGMVPGTGNSDSFYTSLPVGSFVIRKKATQAMGAGRINDIASGRQKFAVGGEAKWRDVEAQMRGGRGRPSKKTTTVGEAVDKVSSKEYNNRKGRFKSDFPFIIRGLNRAGTKAQINEEAILDKYLKKGVNDLSKAIVNQTQGNITVPSSDIDIQNKESIYGGLFETALLKISKRSADKKDNSQNFDFPRGIGPILSNIFSGMPPSISTDVKRTAAANAGMKSNIANKLANEMASNRLPKQPMPVGVVSLSPMDSAIVSKISGAEVNKLLNTKLKQKSKSQRRGIGGLIQKFAKGGLATRNVGYIDSDEITQLLKDSVKGPLIKAEMDRLGIKGVTEYKEHLANLAATRRNDGSLKRLTNIFGVAGSGKSTMLQGGSRAAEADNARLRKTNRYPVLTEQDILRSDQIVDSTSVAGPTQRTALSSADRVIALSSRTKESQEALKKNRKSRDTSGRNLFGRRPGSTKSAPLDSGMGEAYIAASGVSGVDPKKVVTMKLGEKFRKTRTSQPTVRTPDKTGLFYGNFGPTTKGHTSVVKEAEKMGIPAKDFVALVGGDTPIDYTDKDPHSRRTAIFPQKSSDQLPSRLGMARAAFGAMGANVSAMPKGSGPGSIPSAFKVGEDSYIVPKGKGDIAFVGDEKEAGSLSKYEKLGYGVKSLPRSGGISGTKAREAIAANDIPALKKLLSPAGFEYVQKHMATLQQRPKLLDAILSKIERNSASGKGTVGRLSQIKSQLADLPSRVSKTTPADIVAKIESLRKERDSLSSKVGRLPSKLMSRLEQRQKFAVGDEVKKRKIKKINPNDYSQSIQNLQNDPNSILRQQAVGVAILQGPKKGVADSSVSKKSIIQSVGKQYSDLLGSAVAGGSIGIQREALKPQVYKDFNEGIENGLVQAVNTAVGTISSKYPELPTPAINGEEERRKYLKGVNDAAKGNMFEEMLTSMRNKGQYDANPDPQRSFDFAPNKGSAFGLSNIFDKISSLLYVDAKASNPSDAAMSKKIANQTLRDLGVIKGRKSKDVPDKGSLERDISKRLQSVTEDSPLSLQDLQKELPNAKLKMTNSIAKSMGLVVDRAGGKTNFIRPKAVKRAAGGEVPILAQEGEYVINKRSAKAIGYGNLHSLNKYHTGGVVQKFSRGSSLPVADMISQARSQPVPFGPARPQTPNSLRSIAGLEKDASSLGRTVGQLLNDFKKNRDKFYADARASGQSKAQASRSADTRTAAAYNNLMTSRGLTSKANVSGQSLRQLNREGYLKGFETNVPKGVSSSKLQSVEKDMRRVFGSLETTLDKLVNAGERSSKKLTAAVRQQARQAADRVRMTPGTSEDDARAAYRSTQRAGMRNVRAEVQRRQSLADQRLQNMGVQTTDATGKRLTRKQIQENSSRALDLNKKAIEGRKESLVRSRFRSLQQDNPGRVQSLRNAISNRLTGGTAPTRRTDASLMAQARQEVEKILQLETKRANETAKQLSNERAKTNASAKARAAASGGGAAAVVTGGGSGGRRGSSSAGQPGSGSGNRRIMGMGRLTQAGFGISMMGGLGSQFFNPESSATNAANAAFTESFTSTIGMGATVAGSIGDLFGGGGGDDDSPRNRNRNRSSGRGSRNRGGSPPTRPPRTPPAGGSGSAGSGSSRRGGGAPRIPAGGGTGSSGGMSMLGGIGTALGVVAAGALAVAEGLKAAHNAAREFAINVANNKLGESLEKANQSIEKFSNNLSDKTLAAKAKENTLSAIRSADALDTASTKAQAGLFNLNDAMEGGAGSYERSQILNSNQGISGYLSTISLGGMLRSEEQARSNQSSRFQELIPQLSSERAKRYTGASEASASFLEAKVRSGTNIDQMKATDPEEFIKLTKSLALADAAIQEQIMTIQNSTSLTAEQKKKTVDSIIAQEGEKKARDINTKALRDKSLEQLNKTTNILQNSLERMFQNMDQAINANVASLDKLSNQAELTASSLSGQAKIGTNFKLDSINVLDNPRAYDGKANKMAVSQASSIFGAEANKMSGLLQLGNKLEGSLMATINNTLKENKGSTNEAVGARLDNVISNALNDLQIPDDVALNLGKEMSTAIQEMRKKGEDKVDFSELTERIPQLSKVVESSKRAHEIAKRALEQWQGAVNEYANAINQITEMQIEASARSRRANSIMIQGQNDLQRALGKEISLRDARNNTLQGFEDQTGGVSDPRAIGRNIRNLESVRAEQQSLFNSAGNKGPGATGEVQMMGDQLLRTNMALRENYDALKSMADNTEIAGAALNKISEIRQQRQAGVGFAEKLVSSTPKELANLNMSMARLQNNMAGRMNVSNAGQRSADLQLFNELAPLLGDRQSEMKANVLETMLQESGVGVSPMMQDVLDSLRNPEADPAMQEAIQVYKDGVAMQATANQELSRLSELMSQNTADIAAQKLVQTLQGVTLNFDSARLSDINNGIQSLLAEVKNNNGAGLGGAPAVGKARGGIIYASEGTMVNFQPKGTDTVPAMLTPGEFVVNRKATQKNLGLLKRINGGSYSSGGQVNYYADGGYVFDKEWTPRTNLVDSDEGAQKRSAGRYNSIDEKETKNYLPLLNFDYLDKVDLQDLWTVKNAPSYIVNNQADMLTRQWLFPGAQAKDIDVNTAGLQWRLGASYESFSLPLGGGAGVSSLSNVKTTSPGDWDSLSLPTWEWISKINDNAERRKIKQGDDSKKYIAKLNKFLNDEGKKGGIPKVVDQTDSLGLTVGGKLLNLSKNAGGIVADGDPNIDFTVSGNRLTVSGLSKKPKSNIHSLLLDNGQYNGVNSGDDKGNFIAARQDFTSVGSAILEGISYAILTAGGLLGTETGILGTAITAGRSVSSNPLGLDSWNFGEALSKYVKPNSLSKNVMDSMSSNISSLSKIFEIKEKAALALSQLTDPKSFIESSSSTGNKKYASKLQSLIDGIVFKQTFDDTEIKPNRGQGPYTLYDMADQFDIWKQITEGAKNNKEATEGSYAATPDDFIKVYSVDEKGNIAGIKKSFPWINSGFTGVNRFNNLEAARAQDKTKAMVKVVDGFFTGKGISFPYRTVTSKLWNTQKGRFDEKIEGPFDIIDIGGMEDKNNPNPFNELNYLGPLSAIRTPDAKDLGNIIVQQAQANQGAKFSLAGQQASIINRLSSSGDEISSLGVLDNITKENIYVKPDGVLQPEWNTPVFAERYKAKIAQQEKEEKVAAAAQVGANEKVVIPVTAAHRTSLARILHRVAMKNRVGMVGPMPNKQEDIYRNIDMLGRTLSMPRLSNDVATKANATRSLFNTILTDQGNKLQTWITSAGFNLNTVFDKDQNNIKNEVKRKLAKPGMRGKELTTVYYQFKQEAQKKLEATFQTLLDSESAGNKFRQFNQKNKLDTDTQNSLKLEGVQEASRDANGNIVYKSLKENIPKTYQDIANFSLNPYNRFPNNTARGQYLDKLSEVVANGKDNTNRPLYNGKIKTKILQDIANLKTFYVGTTNQFKGLDYYTNSSVNSADILEQIGAATDLQTDYSKILETAAKSHLFLTQNAMGPLPSFEKFMQLVEGNKIQEENKPKQPTTAAKGGVIYASTGTLVDYQPRGTDTVPAMLTPGEFVVNRSATQKHLPLLRAINNGVTNPKKLSKGGMAYLAEGGLAELQQSFADLGSWYPDADRISQVKQETATQANEIAKQKEKDRVCIDKIYGEEKIKQSKRLEATGSEEYRESVRQTEEARMASMDKRREIFAEIKRMQDSFIAQFRQDLASIREETGLNSLADIFAKFPRLKAESEFTKSTGDVTKLSGKDIDKNVKNFRDNLSKILNTVNGNTQTFAAAEDIKNMFDIKAFGAKSFATAKPKALDENKALNKEELRKAIEDCKTATAQSKQFGGMIYASQGTLVNYQPRGTDTVPAMLTPGEFVVNRQSTSKNLPLLRAINSNRYQTGGVVAPKYYKDGALASGMAQTAGAIAGMIGIKLDTKTLESDLKSAFSTGAQQLKTQLQNIFGLQAEDRSILASFGTNLTNLVSQLAQVNIPPEIRFSMQPVQVNITGAQGLTDAAQSLVDGAIKKAFDNFLSINDLQGTYKAP